MTGAGGGPGETAAPRLWIWRHLRLELPPDWELLQFTRRPQRGRCAFADRYGFRLEISWRNVPSPPDFDRMMGDYAARLRARNMPDARRIRVARWPGLHGVENGVQTTRFGQYFDEASCILEAVFLWPDDRDAALERAVLRGIAEEPPREGGARRWRAFGLDVLVPAGTYLEEARVVPGEVDLVFQDPAGRSRVRARRIGLVDRWLKHDLGEWIRRERWKGRVEREYVWTEQGHTVFHREGRGPDPNWRRLLRGPTWWAADAWRCPEDGRVYARDEDLQRRRPPTARDNPFGRRICCAGCGEVTA